MKKCPCQSGKTYKLCCRPYHLGKIAAPTAETLMRSRYSAYVLKLPHYLYKSWHTETRPSLHSLRQSNTPDFINLQIIDTQQGLKADKTGTVTFIATYKTNAQQQDNYQEKSEFRRENNKWVYYQAYAGSKTLLTLK